MLYLLRSVTVTLPSGDEHTQILERKPGLPKCSPELEARARLSPRRLTHTPRRAAEAVVALFADALYVDSYTSTSTVGLYGTYPLQLEASCPRRINNKTCHVFRQTHYKRQSPRDNTI
jgi:hypothetical protein